MKERCKSGDASDNEHQLRIAPVSRRFLKLRFIKNTKDPLLLQRNIKETQRLIQDTIHQRQKHLQKLREAVKSHKVGLMIFYYISLIDASISQTV